MVEYDFNETRNFEEVEEAYWFGPVCLFICPSVCLSVFPYVLTLALGQQPLESWDLDFFYVGRVWKLRRPVCFFLAIGFVIADLLPFSKFFIFIALKAYGSL